MSIQRCRSRIVITLFWTKFGRSYPTLSYPLDIKLPWKRLITLNNGFSVFRFPRQLQIGFTAWVARKGRTYFELNISVHFLTINGFHILTSGTIHTFHCTPDILSVYVVNSKIPMFHSDYPSVPASSAPRHKEQFSIRINQCPEHLDCIWWHSRHHACSKRAHVNAYIFNSRHIVWMWQVFTLKFWKSQKKHRMIVN